MVFLKERDYDTKEKWSNLFNDKLAELRKSEKETVTFSKPCNRGHAEDYCTCPSDLIKTTNWKWSDLASDLKTLWKMSNRFCDWCNEAPLLPEGANFCHLCGEKKEYVALPHEKCRRFSFEFDFCPDCGRKTSP